MAVRLIVTITAAPGKGSELGKLYKGSLAPALLNYCVSQNASEFDYTCNPRAG